MRRWPGPAPFLAALSAVGTISPALAVCVPDLTAQSGITVTCNNLGTETAQQGNGTNDNVTLTVQPGALIDRTGQSLGVQVRTGNTITVDGEVRARNAIQVEGSNNSIVVGSGGIVRDNTTGLPSAAIRLNSAAGVSNTITIDPGGLVTGNSTTEVIAISGQATIVSFGTISNTTGGSGSRFAIFVNPATGGATSVTNGGTITGAGGAAAQLSDQNDTWTQLTGATVTGFVNARGGTGDRLVLSGGGSAALNASTIGPTGQWRNFELFEKAGAGTWTITGSGTQPWTISAGTLIGNATSLRGPITDNATLIFNQTGAGTRAGPISGTGQVIKQGAGTLTLTGANTYSGGTTVSGGTLAGNTASLQGNITNNAAVLFNQAAAGTYGGVLGGTGLLVKRGAGALTLSGASTYTGGTRIDAGTLRLSTDENLGAAGGTLTFNGGTAALQYLSGFTSTRPLTLNAAGGRIDTNGNDSTLAGVISGPGRLTRLGAGTLTLSGNNTYSGGTTVSAGALAGNTASIRGTITNNGAVVFDQGTAGTYASVISGTGTVVKQGAGTLTLSGNNTYSGGTAINAGTLRVGSNANLGGAAGALSFDGGTLQYLAGFASSRPVTLAPAGGTIDTNSTNATLAGPISGPGGLTKTGAGALTLLGANSYTGGTTVGAGALLVNGAIGSVTVLPGALLGGTGSFGPAIVQGTLAPGTSLGTLSTGSLTLNGTYQVEVNAAGRSDRTNVTGTVILGPSSALDVLAAPGDYRASTAYLIIDNDGTDAVTDQFATVAVDSPFLLASVDYAGGDGNDVVLRLRPSGVTFTGVAATSNQAAVAAALSAVEPTATGDLGEIIGQLIISTTPEVRDALDALSGNVLATLDGLNPMTTFVHAMVGASIPGPWVIGLGGSQSVDGDGNAAGYRSWLAGPALGLNLRLGDRWTAGLGIGYGHTTVDSRLGRASIDSLWAAARAVWEPQPLRLQAIAGYGYDSVDSDRRIRFALVDRTATSDFAYHRFMGVADAGFLIPVGPARLEPFGQLAVTRWWRGGYREEGAGDIGLRVDSNRGTSLLASAGLRGGWASGIWSLDGTLAWQGVLAGRRFTTRAELLGAPGLAFDVSGVAIPRHAIVSGARLGLGPLRVAYEAAVAPGRAFSQSATGGFEFRW
jgi:fibronectin-binding autotransporter adhesin